MSTPAARTQSSEISVRPMAERDLATAQQICRLAFGTFVGFPDPENFWPDRDYVATRWRSAPSAALVAELDGKLAGSNFAAKWGSFGFFGPLTVRPEFWDRHVAQSLLGPTMELFEKWGLRETGLFTFAHSPKHIALYQKFGYWPRFLTAILSKGVTGSAVHAVQYSALDEPRREQALAACRELAQSIYDGLDLSTEIRAVQDQQLGDTVLVYGGDVLDGFAVCHCGSGTEAGEGACYVKFAAARSSTNSQRLFSSLLAAIEALAFQRGLHRIDAGVNLNRAQAYTQMLERGFRTNVLGVAMHRPNAPAYNRPDAWVLDDWR